MKPLLLCRLQLLMFCCPEAFWVRCSSWREFWHLWRRRISWVLKDAEHVNFQATSSLASACTILDHHAALAQLSFKTSWEAFRRKPSISSVWHDILIGAPDPGVVGLSLVDDADPDDWWSSTTNMMQLIRCSRHTMCFEWFPTIRCISPTLLATASIAWVLKISRSISSW